MPLKYIFEGREQEAHSLYEWYEQRYDTPFVFEDLCVGIWSNESFVRQVWVVRVGDLEKIVLANRAEGLEGQGSLASILEASQNKRFIFLSFSAIQLGGFFMDLQWRLVPQGRPYSVSCTAETVVELSRHMYLPEDILAYGVYAEMGTAIK